MRDSYADSLEPHGGGAGQHIQGLSDRGRELLFNSMDQEDGRAIRKLKKISVDIPSQWTENASGLPSNESAQGIVTMYVGTTGLQVRKKKIRTSC